MNSQESEVWDQIHRRYAAKDWINKPSIFAKTIVNYLPNITVGKILELGSGQGQDARYFANLGYEIVATDFSTQALEFSQEKSGTLKNRITFMPLDLRNPLPFKNSTFSVVYSHLALHYFDAKETKQLFSEIARVLMPGGVVALLVNSTSDPEYGNGVCIEEDYFEIEGIKKRYFSLETMEEYCKGFEKVLLDNEGETDKDNAIGVKGLIRFVGRRSGYIQI